MGCSVCGRSACIPSFHSVDEQEASEAPPTADERAACAQEARECLRRFMRDVDRGYRGDVSEVERALALLEKVAW